MICYHISRIFCFSFQYNVFSLRLLNQKNVIKNSIKHKATIIINKALKLLINSRYLANKPFSKCKPSSMVAILNFISGFKTECRTRSKFNTSSCILHYFFLIIYTTGKGSLLIMKQNFVLPLQTVMFHGYVTSFFIAFFSGWGGWGYLFYIHGLQH